MQPSAHIGANTIINTCSSVDHDCDVGDHVSIAAGARLSGGVNVGPGAFIGTGAVIIHDLTIGEGAVIAAGAVVVDNVEPGGFVGGVPARSLR